jgi:hypothetical protein
LAAVDAARISAAWGKAAAQSLASAARAGAAFFGDGRAYTPPLAGAVTWNVARRPPQPGHVSGFMPTTRASPPRAGDRP